MKIKSLLFAALVAGMSFTAAAETYTNVGDKVTSPDQTIVPGVAFQLPITLDRVSTAADFTNIQVVLEFPEGFATHENAEEEDWAWAGEDITTKKGIPYVTYTCAFKDNKVGVVGVNMTKTAQTAQPCNFLTIEMVANEGLAAGEYVVKAKDLKYTSVANDSYESWWEAATTLCTLKIEGSDGVNDLNTKVAKTYKTIENGQVVIVKGDVKYNTMGQIVK